MQMVEEGAAEKKRSIAFVVHGGTIMAALHRLAEGEHSFYDWQTGNGGAFSLWQRRTSGRRAERSSAKSESCPVR